MNALSIVFLFKIGLTLLLWCGPLLLLTNSWFQKLGFPLMMPDVYLKLLGWAYLALVVGYCFGLRDTFNGVYPFSTIWLGIISNAGASLILLIYGIKGLWNSWGAIAQSLLWLSMAATGGIALALIFFGLLATSAKP